MIPTDHKPYIPAKTSPYALWWHIKNSHSTKGHPASKLPLFCFVLAVLDSGAILTNTQKRPIIKLPKDFSLDSLMDTLKTRRLFNFQAKRHYLKLLSELPPGLNH